MYHRSPKSEVRSPKSEVTILIVLSSVFRLPKTFQVSAKYISGSQIKAVQLFLLGGKLENHLQT